MKKILFHAHEFNLREGGPCTKRIDSLAKYLSNNGYDVTVITSSHNKFTEGNIDRKYKVIYSYSTKDIKGTTLKRFLNNIVFGITSFLKSFKIGKFDVVITTSPPPLISIFGYFIAKVKKAKLVYDIRDIWPDVAVEMESFKETSIYYKVFKWIANFMYKHSDYITTVTPGKVKKIKKYADNDKVIYIPNGFDDSFIKFDIDEKIIEEYQLKEKFTVVYIGNVGLAQNLDAMVNLAQQYKYNANIQFLIFGDGAYRQSLELKINEKQLKNIKLLGKIDYSKVRTILTYAKISFISLKNNKMIDSVPTKMFDALGVGCPVILLAKGDSCDILKKSKLGLSVESVKELNNAFEYMLKNYDQYADKKEYSINYIQSEFSRRQIAEKFEMEVIRDE